MMRGWFRGIGWRIFSSFSILFITLLLGTSYFGLRFARQTIVDGASNELRVLSITLSKLLHQRLDRIKSGLRQVRADPRLLRAMDEATTAPIVLNDYLRRRLQNLRDVEEMAVFSRDGRCLATTDSDWEHYNAKHEAFITKGARGYYLGEIFDAAEVGKIQIVSMPIVRAGVVRGVLVGQVRLRSLYDLMDQKLGVLGSSEAFLVDAKLRFITPNKLGQDALLQSDLAQTPLAKHLNQDFG